MHIVSLLMIILAVILFPVIYSKGRIALRIQKITCTVHDPLAIKMELCSLKAVNRTTTLINIAGNYTRSLDTFMVNSQMFKKSEVKYNPFLINVTHDYCELMSKKNFGAYMKIAVSIVKPYTNMDHKCPYYGYHYVKNLPVDEDKVPAVWPSGSYLLNVLYYEANNNKILTTHVYFETKTRGML